MQLINSDGVLNLDLIDNEESFSLKEKDLEHTPLVKDLKSNSSFSHFHIKLTILNIGDNSYSLTAIITGQLQNTCGRCIRDFNRDINIPFEEILLFTKKSVREKKQDLSKKNDHPASPQQHYNLGTESDTFVQEITSYKFALTKWLYENIIIALSEQSNLCKKKDCDSLFQSLLKTTNVDFNTTSDSSKPNTHKAFSDLLKPLKKH